MMSALSLGAVDESVKAALKAQVNQKIRRSRLSPPALDVAASARLERFGIAQVPCDGAIMAGAGALA